VYPQTLNEGAWYFSIVDVVEVLTDSIDAKDYWYRLKKREEESSGIELSTICRQLKLRVLDGKLREKIRNFEVLYYII